MKSISGPMSTHLSGEVTTLAWCWKATRRDLQEFGFTSHDQDLTISGLTYYAETGLNATNAQAKVGANVDNLEVAGMLDSSTITEDDVRNGLWDGCEIKVFIVNWQDTSQQLIIQTGTIGDITVKKLQFIAEMRSLSQALQNTIGRVFSRRCDANFGDTRCGINLASHSVSGSVTSIVSNTEFVVDNTVSIPFGTITWTSGLNTGAQMEIKKIVSNNVTIVLPMNKSISIGDTFTIAAGCDKNFTSTTGCSGYSNQVNFRGFPHIPGLDVILETPNAH